jgi:PAS domain S-box-containing protein
MREPRWNQLADGLCDAVVVIDESDRVAYANPAACALLGYRADALVGQPAEIFVPERNRSIDGVPLHRLVTSRARAVRAPVRRREGVEILVDWTGSSTPDGREAQLVLRRLDAPIDVIDPPATTEEPTREILDRIFAHSPVGLFQFDRAGVVTACNDRFAAMIGASRTGVAGLDLKTLVDERIRACVARACAGELAEFEGEYVPVTGTRNAHVRGVFAPLGRKERPLGGIGIFEDVSERIHVERALARSERMASVGTIAAGVAHELNTPLAYVLSSLEAARDHLTGAEIVRIRQAVDTIGTAIEGTLRMRDIVRELRSFAQDDEPRLGPVDPRAAIETAIRLAWPKALDRARVRREFAPNSSHVLASEPKLVQVLVNLLVNARDASEHRNGLVAPIAVRLRTDGREIAVDVVDGGVGIPPENLERMFEPFWSTKRGGLGVGLSLSRSIVTSFGGRIEALSEVGRGSTFTIHLPVAAAPEPTKTPAPESRARILIIEDEARLAFTLKVALEGDHDVVTTTRGREAIELLMRDQAFDLILSDLTIPDLNGPEIYDRVRSKKPDLASRFVFMTGGAFTEPMRDFLARCENMHLDKPFDVAEVTRALAHVRRNVAPSRPIASSAPPAARRD